MSYDITAICSTRPATSAKYDFDHFHVEVDAVEALIEHLTASGSPVKAIRYDSARAPHGSVRISSSAKGTNTSTRRRRDHFFFTRECVGRRTGE